MRRHHGHDRDRDRSAAHVDGRAERDGKRVVVLVKTQLAAQLHVHGDVRRGAAGEKRGEAGILQAAKNKPVGVLAEAREGEDRVGDEGDEEHAAHEHEKQLAVLGEDFDAVGGNRRVDEAQDTEGGERDNPADDGRHSVGDAREHVFHLVACTPKGDAQNDGPCENAEVVRAHKRRDRVGDHVGDKRCEDFPDAGGRGLRLGSGGEREVDGEQGAREDGDGAGDEGAHQVQDDDELHLPAALRVAQGADYQEEHKDGGDAFQCVHEKRAEHLDDLVPGDDEREDGADDEAHDDALDEADRVPGSPDLLDGIHWRSFQI